MKKVVKVFATWCGPCKAYGATWDKVTPKYSDQVGFESIDVDSDTTGFAAKYGIKSIPTTVLLREDGSTIKKVGKLSEQELEELILS
jgi:thioredoxin-like negative regulator of GroEL